MTFSGVAKKKFGRGAILIFFEILFISILKSEGNFFRAMYAGVEAEPTSLGVYPLPRGYAYVTSMNEKSIASKKNTLNDVTPLCLQGTFPQPCDGRWVKKILILDDLFLGSIWEGFLIPD
jgi:hypothetical protein